MNLQLGIYTVKLEDSKASGNMHINLESNEYKIGIKKFFLNYFENRSKSFIEPKKNGERFKVNYKYNEDSNLITGYFEIGKTEEARNIYDGPTEQLSYQKKESDIETRRLHFVLNFNSDYSNRYYIVIQRYGSEGLKDIFSNDLNKVLKANHNNSNERHLNIKLNNIVAEEIIKEDLNSSTIKSVELIKYSISNEFKESFTSKEKLENEKQVLLIQATSLPLKNKLLNFFEKGDKKNIKQLFSEMKFDYDTILIKLELNGKPKSLNLSNLFNYRSQYVLPIELNNISGHDIYKICLEHIEHLKGFNELT